MEQSLASRILAKMGLAILTVTLFDLVFLNWWILKKSSVNLSAPKQQVADKGDVVPSPNPNIVYPSTSPIPIVSATPQASGNSPQNTNTQTVIQKETQTIVQTPQKEIFIPLGSGSTKSNSFSDLGGVEVSIDTTKYPPIDYMVFQASIWVTNGNGKAWAQIINVNDNNPFIESQISSSSATGEYRTSAKIPFVYGPKTYRVQAKTDIIDYAANVSNAVIKIVLK
jgi:hypothetical protein